jgi:hypothetical protein
MLVELWIGRLTQEGFRPTARTASGADTIMVRETGPIRQAIWETADRHEPDRARINLTLTIEDPFQERRDLDAVHVFAGLAADGVEIDFGRMRWWRRAEEPAAQTALLQHGLPWLQQHDRPAPLIALLNHQPPAPPPPAEPPGPLAGLVHWLRRRPAPPPPRPSRRPPVTHYQLALLHYHAGDLVAACRHAEAWLDFVESHVHAGEPERTRRQMAAMSCAPVDTPGTPG